MGALLEVDGIDVAYGSVRALRGVSLSVEAGEMVALLGANGAGKTTVLRAVSGLVPLAGGRVAFDGVDVAGLRPHQLVRSGMAHVPEGRDLFPSLTVVENLRYGFWTQRRRGGFEARVDEVFGWFPALAARRSSVAGRLSGGEQQMLALGRALMSSPRLLLVDELSLGLGPLVVEALFDVLQTLNEAGMAMLLVEQYAPVVLSHTRRAYVLGKGEVRLERASAELRDDPALLASYLGVAPPAAPAGSTQPSSPPPSPVDPTPSPTRPRRPTRPRPA